MNIENPLTLEEQVSVTNLIGHDIMSQHSRVLFSGQEDFAYARNSHVRYVMTAIHQLTKHNCFYHSSKVDDNLDVMQKVFEGDRKNLSIDLDTNEKKLPGEKHVLYTLLYNLAKNGFNAMKQKGTVTITISEHLGSIIKDPIFVPEGVQPHGYFMKYDVHDTGEGFPTDKPLKDSLQFGVTTRHNGTGFGLYFAILASKYLQAPLAITSEPGNTHITLFHPVNLGKE